MNHIGKKCYVQLRKRLLKYSRRDKVSGSEMALEEVTLDSMLWLELCPKKLCVEVLTPGTSEYDHIWERVTAEVII